MAADHTISQAVTKMRGTVWAIVDPGLSKPDINALYVYFEHHCAFCDAPLNRQKHEGRLDRIDRGVAHASGNTFVVCSTCRKTRQVREKWEAFLRRRCPDPALCAVRADRIRAWIAQQPPPPALVSPTIEEITERLFQLQDAWVRACGELRLEARRLRQQITVDEATAEGTDIPVSTAIVDEQHDLPGPGPSTSQSSDAAIPLPANTDAMRLGLKALARRPRRRTAEDGAVEQLHRAERP